MTGTSERRAAMTATRVEGELDVTQLDIDELHTALKQAKTDYEQADDDLDDYRYLRAIDDDDDEYEPDGIQEMLEYEVSMLEGQIATIEREITRREQVDRDRLAAWNASVADWSRVA